MTKTQNFTVTLIVVTANFICASVIPSIGDAMTLVGSTINPVIGFIMPVAFYWHFIKKEPWHNKDKVAGVIVVVVITAISLLSLYQFISDKVKGN